MSLNGRFLKKGNKIGSINSLLYGVVQDDFSFPIWKSWEQRAFQFFFIFLLLLTLPIDFRFYKLLFSIDWLHINFYSIFQIVRYQTQFLPIIYLPKWGIGSFGNWGVAAIVAFILSQVWWHYSSNYLKNYTALNYWLRVILRYRLASLLIVYGFIKVFPIQMPFPSLSNLVTNYGDFYAWKIYFQTLGISPKYESFLGFIEIFAAILLINRKTATFGTGLLIGFLGNVAVANGFYDIGEHVLSTYIVLLSVFLFAYDIPRLYNYFIKDDKETIADRFKPDFSEKKLSRIRLFLKFGFIAFILLYGILTQHSFAIESYKLPKEQGLHGAYGYYDVTNFVLNHDTINYSFSDPHRWVDVVFEKWSTISIRDNRPVIVDKTSGEGYYDKDIDRNYELAGNGGRHYYYYTIDSTRRLLFLQNKNRAKRFDKFTLHYTFINDSTLALDGSLDNSDSAFIVLRKKKLDFLMFEGRRHPVKN
ncbi:hypothetical protein SAMN05192529_10698 [Arachidicoccus rhizosphaerae]|uniref:DoxX family protein n=1 Tax=Arachidicoccus rhizosphaerae TaxID=551991 RepID=A0A1H3XUZ4_9BACT|nr:DoxX family protein [Arachidicoccus rhizosphaerae]SEA02434.1 hypothetical protein SAMN05192529_10698 [Arachidicoccus rhizosphaerae]